MARTFCALPSPLVLAGFIANSLLAITHAFVRLAVGDWLSAAAAPETVMAAFFSRIRSPASAYVFNNSNYVLRPLWTYDAEAKGAIIELAFYSSNCERMSMIGGPVPAVYPGYPTMTWSSYLVWNDDQAAFVKQACSNMPQIRVAGAVPFIDSAVEPRLPPRPIIAVFNVQPLKASLLAMQGRIETYYTSRNVQDFMEQVAFELDALGFCIALKEKRDLTGRYMPASYRAFVTRFRDRGNVVNVESECGSGRLISMCQGVISFPFTSTAQTARYLGKPSVYFDPTGRLSQGQRGAQGIAILDREQLRLWLNSLVNNRPSAPLDAHVS